MQPNTLRLPRNALGRARWDDTKVNYWTRGDGRALSISNTVTAAVRTIAREMRQDEGNAATTTRYCGNGGGKIDSDGGGESKGSAATTEGYCGNNGGGNEDNSKSNSGKNWERGGNNGGGVSHLSLIFFFLVGLTTRSQGLFFAQYITVT